MPSPLPLNFLTGYEPWVQAAAGLALLLLLATATRLLALLLFMPVLRRVRQQAQTWLTEVALHDDVLRGMARVLPSLVVQLGVERIPHLDPTFATVVGNVAMAFMVVQVVRALMAMLDAVLLLQQRHQSGRQGMADAAFKCRQRFVGERRLRMGQIQRLRPKMGQEHGIPFFR